MVQLFVGSPLSISVKFERQCRGLARDVTQQRRNQKVVRHGLYAANSCRASSQSSCDKCHAMKLLYVSTLLFAALLSVADGYLPVLSTVPGGRSISNEEPNVAVSSLPDLSTVLGGRSTSYELLNGEKLPVLATVPGEHSFSYKEPKHEKLPVLPTVPGEHSFSYKEPKHGSLPDDGVNVHAGRSFSYEGPNGPDHWADEYPTCAGNLQSPINIEEHLVEMVRLPPLVFRNFNRLPVTSTLSNNGHTVMLQMELTSPAVLSGGPLNGDYVFHQLHFHWGNNDSVGSEGTINNLTFPLEMHMVTYKETYGNFDDALEYSDGLAVLAVFFEIYGNGNPYYSEITRLLPQVTQPDTKVNLQNPVTLFSLLPEIKHLYFTYKGSLTTPPCLEVVTWIQFKQPILLNHNQVQAFRTMRSPEGELTFNFRPTQPLSDRIVRFNVADNMRRGQSSNNSAVSPFVTSFMLGIFLVLMLIVVQK